MVVVDVDIDVDVSGCGRCCRRRQKLARLLFIVVQVEVGVESMSSVIVVQVDAIDVSHRDGRMAMMMLKPVAVAPNPVQR